MVRVLVRSAGIALLLMLFLPALAAAQAVITGVVKDASGAVLPGVTVEAASPALIEKVRSVVSDSTGQYRIVSLPPGAYSVTFTLPGFSTVKREDLQLTGNFVATVNIDLKVSDLQETITVTGETPVVDIQSTRTQQTLTDDVLEAIPTSRTNANLTTLIPGIQAIRPDVGGVGGTSQGDTGPIHGGRYIDSRSLTDGMSTAHGNGGTGTGNLVNVASAQEVVISTSGGLAEAETSGVTVNVIPRDGSNTFRGSFFVNGANGSMQSSNYSETLRAQGLSSPAKILKVYDVNPQGGGRIIKDKLWFYLTERQWGADQTVPGIFFNKNAGDPTKWNYEPDESRPAFNDAVNKTHIVRLTWQATKRNKITGYWSEQYSCERCKGGGAATATPESFGIFEFSPSRVQQMTYSAPVTNRFLIEAGFGTYNTKWGSGWKDGGKISGETDGTFKDQLVRVVEQGGAIPGLTYRAPANYNRNIIFTKSWRASISYVPGAHNMKFGYYAGHMPSGQPNITFYTREDFQYRFNNGIPNQVSITGTYPGDLVSRVDVWPVSLYAQDQWTHGRWTLQGGVRYDRATTSHPTITIGGTRIIPQPIVIESGKSAQGYVAWNDVSPRLGVAYDLFGTGKTAVKFNLGRYVEALSSLNENALNPTAGVATTTTRSWTDTNRDYVPDCEFANPDGNGECGPSANRALGTATIQRNWDPNYIHGWGKRPDNWELAATVQQELAPRVAVTVGYFRRWFGNWYATDNRAIGLEDQTPFYITAPLDPRLPGGGGYQVGPIYDVVPSKFGAIDYYSTQSSNFAKQTENWNGVDVNVNARLGALTVQGGISTGKKYADNCALREVLPELGVIVPGLSAAPVPTTINRASPVSNPYCHYEEPFLTRAAGLASYTIPKLDVQVSTTFSSNPGIPPVGETQSDIGAYWVIPNSVVRQSLGRDLSGGVANVTVNLIEPGTQFADRLNQVDLRIAKIMRFGHFRTQFMADIYNLTNTDTTLTYNQNFVPGGQWLTPTSILTARFLKLGVQVDF